MNQMEREALEAALRSDSPPLLLEALPPRYYDDAHLPGAIRIDEERGELHGRRRSVTHFLGDLLGEVSRGPHDDDVRALVERQRLEPRARGGGHGGE